MAGGASLDGEAKTVLYDMQVYHLAGGDQTRWLNGGSTQRLSGVDHPSRNPAGLDIGGIGAGDDIGLREHGTPRNTARRHGLRLRLIGAEQEQPEGREQSPGLDTQRGNTVRWHA